MLQRTLQTTSHGNEGLARTSQATSITTTCTTNTSMTTTVVSAALGLPMRRGAGGGDSEALCNMHESLFRLVFLCSESELSDFDSNGDSSDDEDWTPLAAVRQYFMKRTPPLIVPRAETHPGCSPGSDARVKLETPPPPPQDVEIKLDEGTAWTWGKTVTPIASAATADVSCSDTAGEDDALAQAYSIRVTVSCAGDKPPTRRIVLVPVPSVGEHLTQANDSSCVLSRTTLAPTAEPHECVPSSDDDKNTAGALLPNITRTPRDHQHKPPRPFTPKHHYPCPTGEPVACPVHRAPLTPMPPEHHDHQRHCPPDKPITSQRWRPSAIPVLGLQDDHHHRGHDNVDGEPLASIRQSRRHRLLQCLKVHDCRRRQRFKHKQASPASASIGTSTSSDTNTPSTPYMCLVDTLGGKSSSDGQFPFHLQYDEYRRYPRRSKLPGRSYDEDACNDTTCEEYRHFTSLKPLASVVAGMPLQASVYAPRHGVPAELAIHPSRIHDAGLGVFARHPIPVGTLLGAYAGEIIPIRKLQPARDPTYMWEVVCRRTGERYVIDGMDPATANWMRYVNCANSESEQNLIAFQHNRCIYYRTACDIATGTELLIWYGGRYAKQLGITNAVGNRQRFPMSTRRSCRESMSSKKRQGGLPRQRLHSEKQALKDDTRQ
eukprot:scpid48982/ scgid2795/ Histone-lysine N-methyltransferase PRDM9; Hybrid sterility protein 1; Meiosis-induced factor containing a PR/SET domain and zinc-finger motif; PR domain zinc finger protein 9; PR domain-containing protein 9